MPDYDAFDLLRRCAAHRDSRLWEEFLVRFSGRLRAGVRRGLRRAGLDGRSGDLDDIVQEVYCKLLDRGGRNLRRCRGGGEREVGAYLGRVAETVAIDHLRAARASKRGRARLVSSGPRPGQGIVERALDPGLSPEERLLGRERRRMFLATCLAAAGRHSRRRDCRIFLLAVFRGLTSREISERLGRGMSPSGVDSLVSRMRKRLRARGLTIPRRKDRPGG